MDAAEWNLEMERVLPQLKVTIRTDNKVRTAEASHRASCSAAALTLVSSCSSCPAGLEDPSGPDASAPRRDQVIAHRHQGAFTDPVQFYCIVFFVLNSFHQEGAQIKA